MLGTGPAISPGWRQLIFLLIFPLALCYVILCLYQIPAKPIERWHRGRKWSMISHNLGQLSQSVTLAKPGQMWKKKREELIFPRQAGPLTMVTSRVGFPTVRHGWHLRHHKQHSVSHKQNKHKQHSVKEVSWYWGSGWQRRLDWSGAFLQGWRGTEGPKTAQCSCSVHCTVHSVYTYMYCSAQCVYIHILQCTHCRVLEGTPRLTRPALSSCHTSQVVSHNVSHVCSPHITCITSHVTRFTCDSRKCFTSLASHLVNWNLQYPGVMHKSVFNLNICPICLDIMQNPRFPFLRTKSAEKIIGSMTRCKVIMSER